MADNISKFYIHRGSTANNLALYQDNISGDQTSWKDPSPLSGTNWYKLYGLTMTGQIIDSGNPVPVSRQVAGMFDWFRQAQGPDGQSQALILSVATDSIGRTIVTGWFKGTLAIPGGPTWTVASSSSEQVFVIAYDSAGTFKWANRIGADVGHGIANGISVDASDNVIVTGSLSANTGGTVVDFGNGKSMTVTGSNVGNIFVAKFNSLGVCQFVSQFTVGGSQIGQCVTTRTSNGILVGGWFDTSANFGGGNRVASAGVQGYVVALDSSGAWVWDKQFPVVGAGTSHVRALTVDSAGAVVCSGSYGGVVNFGGGARTSGGSESFSSGFTLKLTSAGVYVWDRSYTSLCNCFGVSTDTSTRDVIVTGSYANGTDFGNGSTPTDGGGRGIFVVRYGQSTGAFVWLKYWGGAVGLQDIGQAVTVSPAGNIYVTGTALSPINFGGGYDFGTGLNSHFLLSLNSAGAWRWNQRSDKNGTLFGQSVGLGVSLSATKVISGGWLQGQCDWGGGTVTSGAAKGIGLASYSQ